MCELELEPEPVFAGEELAIIRASEYLVLYTQLAADPISLSHFCPLDCDLELGCSLYSYGRSKIFCSYCRPTDCCLRRTLITPHPCCFASSMLLLSSNVSHLHLYIHPRLSLISLSDLLFTLIHLLYAILVLQF